MYDRLTILLHITSELIRSSLVNFNCVCNTCMFCPCQKTVITDTHLNDNIGLKWRSRLRGPITLSMTDNLCFRFVVT